MPAFQQLPQFQAPSGINFDPLNQGVKNLGNALAQRQTRENNLNITNALSRKDYAGAQGMSDDPAQAMQIGQYQRQEDSAGLDKTIKLAQLYGGAAQMISNEPDENKARAMWQGLVASHPEFATNFARHGGDINDHRGGAKFLTAMALGPRDPGAQDLQRSTIALNNAHARSYDNDAYAVNAVTGQTYSKKTGQPVAGTGVPQDNLSLIADKEFAKKSPEYVQKAAGEFQDANDSLQSIADLKTLAPYAATGFGGESLLTLRKAGSRIGINDPAIAPSEIFRSLQQNFVLTAAQKLKPLSNSDVAFVEKGVATLNSDPSSLPLLLDGFEAIAKRTALARQYQLQYLRQGRQPDYVSIEQAVNQQVPSPIARAYGGANLPPSGTQAAPQTQQTQAGPKKGDMAINPQTKHTIMYDGTKWVDAS